MSGILLKIGIDWLTGLKSGISNNLITSPYMHEMHYFPFCNFSRGCYRFFDVGRWRPGGVPVNLAISLMRSHTTVRI